MAEQKKNRTPIVRSDEENLKRYEKLIVSTQKLRDETLFRIALKKNPKLMEDIRKANGI